MERSITLTLQIAEKWRKSSVPHALHFPHAMPRRYKFLRQKRRRVISRLTLYVVDDQHRKKGEGKQLSIQLVTTTTQSCRLFSALIQSRTTTFMKLNRNCMDLPDSV
uniref:Uncharacterized protein n=1 Tax=Strigamia maritima TaxID=126957 RepID=T1J9V2_STRMM